MKGEESEVTGAYIVNILYVIFIYPGPRAGSAHFGSLFLYFAIQGHVHPSTLVLQHGPLPVSPRVRVSAAFRLYVLDEVMIKVIYNAYEITWVVALILDIQLNSIVLSLMLCYR